MKDLIKITGSVKPVKSTHHFSPRRKMEKIHLTILMRRNKELNPGFATDKELTREVYRAEYATSEQDAGKVEAFTRSHKLETMSLNLHTHTLRIKGRICDVEEAFAITISARKEGRRVYHVAEQDISLPASLKDIITGVFGLDNHPLFKRSSPMLAQTAAVGQSYSYTSVELATLYGYPAYTGQGQCIAIIELVGGYQDSDMEQYFRQLNIPLPVIRPVYTDNRRNDEVTMETTMDIQIAAGAAPGAEIAVYFAENLTDNYLAAINQVISDNKASVISISYGSVEQPAYSTFLDSFKQVFDTAVAHRITVCVSSGDEGADAGEGDGALHVYFPACCPNVLACGGTTVAAQNGQITSETVWHENDSRLSGGGVSAYFLLPDYQNGANVPLSADGVARRGVPDVAANADRRTGYEVVLNGSNKWLAGGTSASTPMIAGLIARFNEQEGAPVGLVNTRLYSDLGACRDITLGDNINSGSGIGYTAVPGWDACTGLGVPFKL